jgi:hypothetical protein
LPDGVAGSLFQFGGTAEARGLDIILKIPDPTGSAPDGKLTLTLPRENTVNRDGAVLRVRRVLGEGVEPTEKKRVYQFNSQPDRDIRLHAEFTFQGDFAGHPSGFLIPGSLPVGSVGAFPPAGPPHFIFTDPLTTLEDSTPSRYNAGGWFKKVADRANHRYLILFNNPELRPDGFELVIPLDNQKGLVSDDYTLQATVAHPDADARFVKAVFTLNPGSNPRLTIFALEIAPDPKLIEGDARLFGFLQ